MQDTSKDLGYMRRDIRQICLFEPVQMSINFPSISNFILDIIALIENRFSLGIDPADVSDVSHFLIFIKISFNVLSSSIFRSHADIIVITTAKI